MTLKRKRNINFANVERRRVWLGTRLQLCATPSFLKHDPQQADVDICRDALTAYDKPSRPRGPLIDFYACGSHESWGAGRV